MKFGTLSIIHVLHSYGMTISIPIPVIFVPTYFIFLVPVMYRKSATWRLWPCYLHEEDFRHVTYMKKILYFLILPIKLSLSLSLSLYFIFFIFAKFIWMLPLGLFLSCGFHLVVFVGVTCLVSIHAGSFIIGFVCRL